jgi:hypothetical protein
MAAAKIPLEEPVLVAGTKQNLTNTLSLDICVGIPIYESSGPVGNVEIIITQPH